MKVKVAILGCSGRMGRNLIQAAVEHKSIELVGGTVRASSSFVNFDLGELAGIGAIGQKTATYSMLMFLLILRLLKPL
jgi:4-hydroxy-tetrahydrodipicolinate reductase